MNQSSAPAIGIDLGTTFSCVSQLDDLGRPLTLANAEGDKSTPSVIFFDGTDVIVGKEAVKAKGTDMIHIAECAKRELGERLFEKAFGGRQYPPEVLQAFILNKLRIDAQQQIGDFRKVVITVPAYFDESHRKATQDAGYIAGFDVMDIINEPTAAAIAYGAQQGFLDPQQETSQGAKILVYDLGGGTFDVTVMEIGHKEFIALATDGDVQLGGHDWDQRLVDFVSEEFIRTFGLDPRDDPNTEGRLWRECEDVKHTLTARNKANIACDYQGQSLRVEVTREQFEDMTRDLLDRTAFTTRQTLQAAGLEWSDIDRVLLVGGSTRMPAVTSMLEEISGLKPDSSISPDESVAHGAALHAGLILATEAGEQPLFHVKNVNSHSLGVVAKDVKTDRTRNAILIPRNTGLPITAKRTFKAMGGQKSILVHVVEGESNNPEDCSSIGRCSIRDLPADLPENTTIEVRFRYRSNGRLTVMVSVADTETQLQHEFTRDNSLTQDQLDLWRNYICGVPSPESETEETS